MNAGSLELVVGPMTSAWGAPGNNYRLAYRPAPARPMNSAVVDIGAWGNAVGRKLREPDLSQFR